MTTVNGKPVSFPPDALAESALADTLRELFPSYNPAERDPVDQLIDSIETKFKAHELFERLQKAFANGATAVRVRTKKDPNGMVVRRQDFIELVRQKRAPAFITESAKLHQRAQRRIKGLPHQGDKEAQRRLRQLQKQQPE